MEAVNESKIDILKNPIAVRVNWVPSITYTCAKLFTI